MNEHKLDYNWKDYPMRTFRILTILCLVVLSASACDAIPFLRATPTRTLQPTWTRIPSRTPSITPSKTIRPTKTVTPIPSITPTRFPTHTPIDIGSEPQLVLTTTTGITSTLGVSYQQVEESLKPVGFVFPVDTPDSTAIYFEATYPLIPMDLEMMGSLQYLSEIHLEFSIRLDDPERTMQATGMMQRLLTLVLPSWEESQTWILETIQEGLMTSDESFERTTMRNGLSVTIEMERLSGKVILRINS